MKINDYIYWFSRNLAAMILCIFFIIPFVFWDFFKTLCILFKPNGGEVISWPWEWYWKD